MSDESTIEIGDAELSLESRPRVWNYEFSVWPDEESKRWSRAVYTLFPYLNTRVVMEFAERDFNDFREELVKVGITLREITRSPYQDSENVH